ncbi:hypothetical protein Hanom_Chr09g00803651 [Helianthus anomalus]
MFHIIVSDDITVFSSTSEPVEPILFITTIRKESSLFRGVFVRGPPDLDAVELVCDFFILIHAQDNRFAILDYICLEPFSHFRGVGTEVPFYSFKRLTSFEPSVCLEFMKSDFDVRVQITNKFVNISSGIPSKLARKQLKEHGPSAHSYGHKRHLPHHIVLVSSQLTQCF